MRCLEIIWNHYTLTADSGFKNTAFLHRVKLEVFDIPLGLQWLERNGFDY